MEEFNLKTDRADVIVPAAEIFLIIAGIVKAEYIHVPVIGLADGIIDNLYAIDASRLYYHEKRSCRSGKEASPLML